jgi:hypothetical protein
MKGTILDLLKLVTENPELAQELVELADRYDFEFTAGGELGDEDLEKVAGGTCRARIKGGAADGVVGLLRQAVAEERSFFDKLMSLMAETSERRRQEDRELG